jgi:hypothetical protein
MLTVLSKGYKDISEKKGFWKPRTENAAKESFPCREIRQRYLLYQQAPFVVSPILEA